MHSTAVREIPFNYTSADDRRILALLLGDDVLAPLERLVFKRRTGRSWRLLMRIIGALFIHRRNPFLYQELVDNRQRRQGFIDAAHKDLMLIADRGRSEPDVAIVIDASYSMGYNTGRPLGCSQSATCSMNSSRLIWPSSSINAGRLLDVSTRSW